MAGGRFLSRDDPTISPDARVRATVGVGNDCEPYLDFGFTIAPPGVLLPNCTTLDRVRDRATREPAIAAVLPAIYDQIYLGATYQEKAAGLRALEALVSVPFDASVGMAGGNVFSQELLAQQLIASGQLTLGPEAFQSPAARAALAMALAMPTASPVGGSMSSSWFGLGGIAPGGTTPILPFGFQAGGSGSSVLFPDAAGGGGGSDVFGSLLGALPGLLTGLAQAGVIRGSVGNALAPMQQIFPQAALPATTTQAVLQTLLGGVANLTPTQVMAGGSLAIDAMQMLSGLFGTNGATCGARPPVQAPSLFRMGCGGRMSLPARQQVVGPDGSLYVIASLGKATRGSREESTMRRLARQNGFTVARKGSARSRGRRRPR